MHSGDFLLFWQDSLRTSASSAVEKAMNRGGLGGTHSGDFLLFWQDSLRTSASYCGGKGNEPGRARRNAEW
jgi:hypothetical protein